MKIIFMGTSPFAIEPLKALVADPAINIVLVVTQPDRAKGRGQKLRFTQFKKATLDLGIDIFQPENINDDEALNALRAYNPDYLVVVAYGQILTDDVLSIPKKTAINIHASLLPKYRGAAPIHYAIMRGETQTGVCTMHMAKELDAGDIIYCESLAIEPRETTGLLHDRLSKLGASLIIKTLHDLERQVAPRICQQGKSTYAPQINKKDRVIDWSKPGEDIVNLIRALQPFPGALFTLSGEEYLVSEAIYHETMPEHISPEQNIEQLGSVVCANPKQGLYIKVKNGWLEVVRLKPQGKKEMSSKAFLNGHRLDIGLVCESEG